MTWLNPTPSRDTETKANRRKSGLAGFAKVTAPWDVNAWNGFVAPAGMPQVVIDPLNKSVDLALADADVIKALTANGFELSAARLMCSKAMSAYVRDISEIGQKNNLEIA